MKTIDGSSKLKYFGLMIVSFVMMICCYAYHNYLTYNSIGVVMKKTASIEFGSANYDIKELIKEVDGEIVSIKKDIDTSKIGEQEIIISVKKENIIRDIPVIVNVVDSLPPVIKLKNEKITIKKDENIDLKSNIESVIDSVDGDISYLDDNSSDKKYYSIQYNDDINAVGSHNITVNAVDSYGNISSIMFVLEVLKPEPVVISQPVFSNLEANSHANDLVSIAYSLIGSPYLAGSNGPYGFDCSGFVQYVYSKVGISVSRSASTQMYDGVAVSYQDAKPGDILNWGYVEGVSTHSALYVGNGQMIHATNPSQGVIASDIAAWTRGSGTRVIGVRRIGNA